MNGNSTASSASTIHAILIMTKKYFFLQILSLIKVFLTFITVGKL